MCSYQWNQALPVVEIGRSWAYSNVLAIANSIFFKCLKEPDKYCIQVILIGSKTLPLGNKFYFLIEGNKQELSLKKVWGIKKVIRLWWKTGGGYDSKITFNCVKSLLRRQLPIKTNTTTTEIAQMFASIESVVFWSKWQVSTWSQSSLVYVWIHLRVFARLSFVFYGHMKHIYARIWVMSPI